MKITIQEIAVLQRGAEDSVNMGVAQVRETNPRGVVTKEGCVAYVLHTKDGKRIDVLMLPEEAREFGVLSIACAFTAAGAPPPTIEPSKPAPASPIIIGGRA